MNSTKAVNFDSNEQWVVTCDVLNERHQQDRKFGDQSGHDDLKWAAIHGEEFGEVCAAILSQKDTDPACLYAELIQLAATCIAHAEALWVRGEAR